MRSYNRSQTHKPWKVRALWFCLGPGPHSKPLGFHVPTSDFGLFTFGTRRRVKKVTIFVSKEQTEDKLLLVSIIQAVDKTQASSITADREDGRSNGTFRQSTASDSIGSFLLQFINGGSTGPSVAFSTAFACQATTGRVADSSHRSLGSPA